MIEYIAILLTVSIFISLMRVLKGPTIADRVIALDATNSIVIAMISLLALFYKNGMFIDIAIVYAMLSFLATLAISKYLIGESKNKEKR